MNKKKFFPLFLLSFITIICFLSPSKLNLKIDTFTKSNTSADMYSIHDNWNNYFKETNAASTQPFNLEVKNVEELCNGNFQLGDKVKTSGYYTTNDGGGAIYQIVKKQTNTTYYHLISLTNGLYASMIIEDNSASVKQFGAKGDGKTDDSAALNVAFNSKIQNITLEEGNYLCTQPINVCTKNLNILGTNTILFTNNNYRKGETSEYTAFFNVFSSSDISISGITIEARETRRVPYTIQFSIRYAENITIDKCHFIIPDTVLSDENDDIKKKVAYSNGDVFTAWHNIVIKNCIFEQLSDTNIGGLIGFRDIYKKGCDTAVFKNNTCTYNGHDEMIAVVSNTSSSVKNVTLENNNFTVLPGSLSTARTMCFAVGYDDNYFVDNIKFINNKIDGYADFAFMTFGNASNVEISKNTINFHCVTNNATPYYFYCTKPTAKSNIIISENNMNFQNNNGMTCFSFGSLYLENNNITLDAPINSSVFFKAAAVNNNQLTFNKSIKTFTNSVLNITDNAAIFKDKVSKVYEFFNTTFSTDCIITNNQLQFDALQSENCTLFMLNGTTLNNHKLTYINNSSIFNENDISEKNLYMLSINDKETQTIIIKNNNLNNFTKRLNYSKTDIEPDIIFEKNTTIHLN